MQCACGTLIRGHTHEELIETARTHIHRDHPTLGQPPSGADLLAMSTDDPVEHDHHDRATADPTAKVKDQRAC